MRYRKTQAKTASREEVLLMLYDGAIRFLAEAIDALKKDDAGWAGQRIGKALAIVGEFQSSLDYRHAPDLCATLESLYLFCTRRLLEANQTRSVEAVEEVKAILSSLRDTWAEAAEKARMEQAQGQGPGLGMAGAPTASGGGPFRAEA